MSLLRSAAKNMEYGGARHSEYSPSGTPKVISPFPPQKPTPTITLLCSRAFLELWDAAVYELATGRWADTMNDSEIADLGYSDDGLMINLIDTILVDSCGVDIELPGRGGIIILTTSSLCFSHYAKQLIVDVVNLVVVDRYSHLFVILCVDVAITEDVSKRIVQLQCAVTSIGMTGTQTFFKYTSLSSVSSSIRSTISNYMEITCACLSHRWNLILASTDIELSMQRAQFLVSLMPTLCAAGAIECLLVAEEILPRGPYFRMLFQNQRLRDKIQHETSTVRTPCEIHPHAMIQLSNALHVSVWKC